MWDSVLRATGTLHKKIYMFLAFFCLLLKFYNLCSQKMQNCAIFAMKFCNFLRMCPIIKFLGKYQLEKLKTKNKILLKFRGERVS